MPAEGRWNRQVPHPKDEMRAGNRRQAEGLPSRQVRAREAGSVGWEPACRSVQFWIRLHRVRYQSSVGPG